jgi:hypothetical protein
MRRVRSLKVVLAGVIVGVVLAGGATALATHVFDDVPDDKFYAEPVEWAAANGITTGKSPTVFDPDASVTRGESVTFLKRFNDYLAAGGVPELQGPEGPQGPAGGLSDVRTVQGGTSPDTGLLPAGETFEFWVECDSDETVLGGGYNASSLDATISSTYPTTVSGNEAWFVGGINNSAGGIDIGVYARCATNTL